MGLVAFRRLEFEKRQAKEGKKLEGVGEDTSGTV